MSELILKIENVSKQYRLGKLGTGTISHDLNRWWHKIRGKEDPYLRIGDINDRTKAGGSDYVWSLQNINLEINKGEVLGVIGKNGAGKSTLLKILSQVTPPTLGEIKVKGRIAALLEVGTGFHPELSGRENIYLNGAILGMTKNEIKSKFDEIVEFSGVAKYIDTPVKRYSSGMMVRLGFAVAAHLEPEILIVDEVLAVGDAEFQEKCLGKMKDVSGQGRTVLFVSHNMSAIKNLCTKGLLLNKGQVQFSGNIDDTLAVYSNIADIKSGDLRNNLTRKGLGDVKFTSIKIEHNGDIIHSGKKMQFNLGYEVINDSALGKYDFAIGVWNNFGAPVFMLSNKYLNRSIDLTNKNGQIKFCIEKLPLNVGDYTINILISKNGVYHDFLENIYNFKVEVGGFYDTNSFYPASYSGFYVDFSIIEK
jgi:lipopolysaccharide transport system ATP-binding protein